MIKLILFNKFRNERSTSIHLNTIVKLFRFVSSFAYTYCILRVVFRLPKNEVRPRVFMKIVLPRNESLRF